METPVGGSAAEAQLQLKAVQRRERLLRQARESGGMWWSALFGVLLLGVIVFFPAGQSKELVSATIIIGYIATVHRVHIRRVDGLIELLEGEGSLAESASTPERR